MKPLVDLLSKLSNGKCTATHMEAMNNMGSIIHSQLKLGLVDFDRDVLLHVYVDEEAGSCMLVQESQTNYAIVAMVGQDLTITNHSLGKLERLLAIVQWGG